MLFLNLIIAIVLLLKIYKRKNTPENYCQPSNDKKSIEDNYLSTIKKSNDTEQLFIAQHCFNRLPGSFNLLKKLWELVNKELEDENDPIYQRQMLVEMDNYISKYSNQCEISNVNKSNDINIEIDNWSKKIMSSLSAQEIESYNVTINGLESKITKLVKSNNEDKQIIEEIQKIDSAIDKKRLENFPELNSKYQELSQILTAYFSKIDLQQNNNLGASEKSYNKDAIACHKEAYEKFDSDTGLLKENDYKKGNRLHELVDLLGGWENRYLLHSTLTYTSTIYNAIFSKLKNDAQLEITKLMIEANRKEINKKIH
jgi:flagellar biosynthesis chaperone FliJ